MKLACGHGLMDVGVCVLKSVAAESPLISLLEQRKTMEEAKAIANFLRHSFVEVHSAIRSLDIVHRRPSDGVLKL